jgi:hypothetical protein
MRNKKMSSMVAVGASLLVIGCIGASQIPSAEGQTEKESSTVAAVDRNKEWPSLSIE